MSETDTFVVGESLPRIKHIGARDQYSIAVTWESGVSEIVDLAPEIFKFKLYAPLREDTALFRSVHVDGWGSLAAWGEGEISMPASAIEQLAAQQMTSADFKGFMRRHQLTLEGAAAQLGISRRQAAYFASTKAVPRTVALACRYLDSADGPSGRQVPS